MKRLEWQADKKGYNGVGIACLIEDIECIVVCESLAQLKEALNVIHPNKPVNEGLVDNVIVGKKYKGEKDGN